MATEVQATPAPEAVAAPARPFSIRIGAPMNAALNEAVQHARNGYCFSDAPIEIMEASGWCWFTMILGDPKEYIINAAKASVERSVAEEAAQYRKDVAEAAKQMLEAQQRAKLEADVAAATAALDKQIAELRKAAQKELAKLN